MKPIKFEQSNCVYAENQTEYLDLPALKDEYGNVTSVWEPTDAEREAIMDGACITITMATNNEPLQPLLVGVTEYG